MKVMISAFLVVCATALLSFSSLGLSNPSAGAFDSRAVLLLAMTGAGLVLGALAVKELLGIPSRSRRAHA